MVDSGGQVWFMMQILFVTSWGNPGRASNLVLWNWQLTLEIRLDWERWIVWVPPYTLFEMFLERSWDISTIPTHSLTHHTSDFKTDLNIVRDNNSYLFLTLAA